MQDTDTNQVNSITDSEKQMISDMLAKRQLLLAQAESALAKNQLAELEHKNLCSTDPIGATTPALWV